MTNSTREICSECLRRVNYGPIEADNCMHTINLLIKDEFVEVRNVVPQLDVTRCYRKIPTGNYGSFVSLLEFAGA